MRFLRKFDRTDSVTQPYRPAVDPAAYARPIRIAALFVAVTSALWEFRQAGIAPDVARSLVIVRATEALVAAAVALLTTPRRSLDFMRAMIFVLALDIAVANFVLMALVPEAVWEALYILTAVILASALIAPWSWRWQAALAALVVLGTFVSLRAFVPDAVLPGWLELRVNVALVTVGAISALGAHLADRERGRVLASEARLRALFHAAESGIAVLGDEGVIREGNARLAALTGFSLDGLRGRRIEEILEPAGGGWSAAAVFAELLGGAGEDVKLMSGRLLRADGSRVEVEVSIVRVPSPEEPLIQLGVRDVSERRDLDRRRAQAARIEAIGRLAAGTAHQFNNLLAGILNQASLLGERLAPPERAQLDAIAEAARRGERLTKALLRFTPHATVELRPVGADAILDHVATLAQAEDGRVQVDVDVRDGLPPVAADPDHLVHALMELVFNARDAMRGRSDPVIRLAAREEAVAQGSTSRRGVSAGRYVRFRVTDNGVGLDAASRERLFEPFFSTKPMHEGQGLGLATVYWVVRAHRGTVAVESQPGRGTTVDLLIPVAAEAARPESGSRPPVAATRPQRVLVVDDDALIRTTVVRALRQFGYDALDAPDGDGAMAAVRSAEPPVDLAILDVVMPGGGVGLVRRMRDEQPDVRLLVSTGYGPSGEVQRMLEAGATGFLQKPYEITELRDAVRAALA